MKLTDEQLADLLLKIADHGRSQAKAFLNGDASIAGSAGTECLEFYDRWREESFPDAPMGEVVDSKQWDQIYDVYLESIKSAFQTADLRSLLVEARDALKGLVKHVERNTCSHEDTYRGGAIWTICGGCGMKWADDEGGMPKSFPTSVPIQMAESTLSKLQSIKA